MPNDPQGDAVVLCSWENPWARAGGLFAVVNEYAAWLRRTGRRVLILTPRHARIGTPPEPSIDAEPLQVPLGFDAPTITLAQVTEPVHACHRPEELVEWVLVSASGFFQADGGIGQANPYVYGDEGGQADESRLLKDSLFFCRAVPEVLIRLGLTTNVVIHLQDWQTGSAAVTVRDAVNQSRLQSATTVLTMHNPYDHGLSRRDWESITSEPFPTDSIHTVYRHMLPLLDAPPATVSRQFARDLRTDTLQTTYFANHLQDILEARGIVGVDNGPFEAVRPPFNSSDLLGEKQARRATMLESLADYISKERRIVGSIAGTSDPDDPTTLDPDIPFFMMSGRLDPRQKGFDVLANAIHSYFAEPREARFLIAADATDAPAVWVDNLKSLADAFPGRVMICAFRMIQAYAESQAGATFCVWPSLYEPFGGVSEFYLKGTPAVARMTGGLTQQVIDSDDASQSESATGITYTTRSAPDRESWQALMDVDSPQDRLGHPVYDSHVQGLTQALIRATTIFRTDKPTYVKMLGNLFESAQQFSWERAAAEYATLYQSAIESTKNSSS